MYEHEHLSRFAGLPVAVFDGKTESADLPAAGSAAWRVATRWDGEPFGEVFGCFLERIDSSPVTALVIGFWGDLWEDDTVDLVDQLVKAADRLPHLRALFLGDLVREESEISQIEYSNLTPLFEVFPRLERFEARGIPHLDAIHSETLKVLRFESGGLPADAVRAVATGELPNLEQLDLWLGVEYYAGDATVADLAPILDGERLPALRRLGLQDSEIQDEIAAAVATAPVVARLELLSLSMGALTDEGAEALLSGQPLTHLKKLDLHHHYLTEAMIQRVRAALPGVEIDLSDQQDPGDDRPYVAVAE